MYTQVENVLLQVPVVFVNVSQLYKGGLVYPKISQKWWSQVSKNSNLKELKLRLIDNLKAAGVSITPAEIRLWTHSGSS